MSWPPPPPPRVGLTLDASSPPPHASPAITGHNQVVLHGTPSHSNVGSRSMAEAEAELAALSPPPRAFMAPASATGQQQPLARSPPRWRTLTADQPQEYIYDQEDDELAMTMPPVAVMAAANANANHAFPTDPALRPEDHSAFPQDPAFTSAAPLPLRPTDYDSLVLPPVPIEHRVSYDADGNELHEHVVTLGEIETAGASYDHATYEPPSETLVEANAPDDHQKLEDGGHRESISDKKIEPFDPVIKPAMGPPRPLSRRDSQIIQYAYRPLLTIFVSLAWTALFIAEFGDDWKMEDTSINPSFGPSYKRLDSLGGKNTFKILGHVHLTYGSSTTETYRIVTSMFWHAGLLQFLPSLFGLLWLGTYLEREYGPMRVGFIFFASGLYGTIFSAVFSVDLLTVSASACVLGLLGARMMDAFLYRAWYARNWPTALALTSALAVALVLGCLPLIDNFAHLGGLLMGALLAGVTFTGGWRPAPDANQSNIALTAEAERTKRYTRTRRICLALVIVVWVVTVLLLWLAVPTTMNGTFETDVWCTDCHKFQCVDTASWTCTPAVYYG